MEKKCFLISGNKIAYSLTCTFSEIWLQVAVMQTSAFVISLFGTNI